MTLKIIGMIALFFLAFWGYCFCQNRKRRQKLEQKIRAEWGERPVREYSGEEFDAISHYYQRKERTSFYIDDITWNDLDMDMIFMLLNHTRSCIGESCLYDLLRIPSFSEKELAEREKLICYFTRQPEQREKMEYFFAEVGKTGKQSIFDYIYNLAEYQEKPNTIHYLCIAGFVLALGSIFVNPALGVLATIGVVAVCWGIYLKRRKIVEPYVLSSNCLLKMLKAAQELEKLEQPETEAYIQCIKTARLEFQKFSQYAKFFVMGSTNHLNGGILESLMMYVNFTLHLDLIGFQKMVRELRSHIDAFETLTENMGILESAIAIASFRKMMGDWCVPDFRKDGSCRLKAEELYHPMIEEPVKNCFQVQSGALITGSNASGKSTFLKTVAINALLAQTVHTCLADSWQGNFFQIYSSMALRDDLMSQESYYIVEIKSLKRILDHMEDEVPLLCFVDEVLRGTNTVERIAASAQILRSMARENTLCFAATHDIELTYILEDYYENYHFQEEVAEGDILFDYCLYEGRAISRNAIKLLGIIGYEKELIKAAEEMAERFSKTGEWFLEQRA